MPRRSGATLIEVLVAIFVMAIGLLALLTLFPIGALRMYQAIQDDRASAFGANARSAATIFDVANNQTWTSDPKVFNPYKNPSPIPPGGAFPESDSDAPSYPVFIDPIGWGAAPNASAGQYAIGSVPWMPRRSLLNFFGNNVKTYRWFTLLDESEFESVQAGALSFPGSPRLLTPYPVMPQTPTMPLFNRDVRYSCAFMCQRPRYADPGVVDVTTVVFNKRPLALTGNLSLPENVYSGQAPNAGGAYFDPANNMITLEYDPAKGIVPPAAIVGDWILDATRYTIGAGPTLRGSAHGSFYRIVGKNEIVDPAGGPRQLIQYEVQNPLRGFNNINTGGVDAQLGFVGTAILLDGVVEVFEKGPVHLPPVQVP